MQHLQPPQKVLHPLAIGGGPIFLLNAVGPVWSKPLLQVLIHVPQDRAGMSLS